jgi:hypothetical protein
VGAVCRAGSGWPAGGLVDPSWVEGELAEALAGNGVGDPGAQRNSQRVWRNAGFLGVQFRFPAIDLVPVKASTYGYRLVRQLLPRIIHIDAVGVLGWAAGGCPTGAACGLDGPCEGNKSALAACDIRCPAMACELQDLLPAVAGCPSAITGDRCSSLRLRPASRLIARQPVG